MTFAEFMTKWEKLFPGRATELYTDVDSLLQAAYEKGIAFGKDEELTQLLDQR